MSNEKLSILAKAMRKVWHEEIAPLPDQQNEKEGENENEQRKQQ